MQRTKLLREARRLLLATLLLPLFNAACTKEDALPVQPESPPAKGLVTPVGTPAGEALAKEIGADGGMLATRDGKLRIEIPAGALSAVHPIGIQPITNAAGKRNAYRLTPHGLTFKQPVQITFAFTSDDLGGNVPEALGVAYQDDGGVWRSVGGTTLDKAAGKLTVSTTHFSDWSFFERFWLEPWVARVDPGGSVPLRVMTYDPDVAPPGSGPAEGAWRTRRGAGRLRQTVAAGRRGKAHWRPHQPDVLRTRSDAQDQPRSSQRGTEPARGGDIPAGVQHYRGQPAAHQLRAGRSKHQ